jgi:alkanesulfonate monooxygenase SsuD/methylene tetrahydromethanopterin reductase-like flavin-dependent oxidoreductase (luciferase family)
MAPDPIQPDPTLSDPTVSDPAVSDPAPASPAVPAPAALAVPALGVVFRPEVPPERLRTVAQVADESGLDELWLWEDCFKESGIAAAAAVLAWTGRVQVGVGLLPVPLRNVALTAMEIATMTRLFPGRFRVGIGHGVQEWMVQVGAKAASPLTLLREYTTALKALLAGETVTADGRYVHLDAVALDWPPPAAPPILAGAIGAKTLALSGEVADGTILVGGTTPEEIRRARTVIDSGREQAGRTDPHSLTVFLIAATGPSADERLARELRMWPVDPADDVAVAGDATAVAAAVGRWAAAGVDSVVLQPTGDEPDLEGFIRFVTDEVRPLLG